MGRGGNRESRMRTLSGALGVHFCLIFSLSFLTSIFHRFFRFRIGFGRVLGDQNASQIEIFDIFWDMFMEIFFLVEFCWIFDKIDGQKHRDFRCVFHVSFQQLFLEAADLFNTRNLKISDFPGGKYIFL